MKYPPNGLSPSCQRVRQRSPRRRQIFRKSDALLSHKVLESRVRCLVVSDDMGWCQKQCSHLNDVDFIGTDGGDDAIRELSRGFYDFESVSAFHPYVRPVGKRSSPTDSRIGPRKKFELLK